MTSVQHTRLELFAFSGPLVLSVESEEQIHEHDAFEQWPQEQLCGGDCSLRRVLVQKLHV